MEARNTLAIPVVMYSFNIINWTIPEIRRLDTKICKLFMQENASSKSCVDRLYITRKERGMGMIQFELSCKTSTIGQHKYVTTTDWVLVLAHDKIKKAHSISKQSYKFKQELNITKMKRMTQTTLQSKQEILRKQAKQRNLSKLSKTGKTNLCMKSTQCQVKKLM